MIWGVLSLLALVAAWYWHEGRWDRRLFRPEPGRTCANIDGRAANDWLRGRPDTQVLDVRSPGEFAGGALPGAINIPLGDAAFDARVGALDRDKPVLVYCAGGFRSRKAVERLKRFGFSNIQHIHRGYLSWKPRSAPQTSP